MMQAIALAVERAAKAGVLLRPRARHDPHRRHRPLRAMDGGARLRRHDHGRRAGFDGLSRRARCEPRQPARSRSRCRAATAPIVLDMATSTISNGKILQARATGASLPPNSALTKEGEPTTDPNRAEILLPLGGAKGSGLGFMFEMLASVLAARRSRRARLGRRGANRCRRTSRSSRSMSRLFGRSPISRAMPMRWQPCIKSLPRQTGFDEIRLPGERAARTEAVRRKSGIPIPGKLWEELRAMAKANAIEMPSVLAA